MGRADGRCRQLGARVRGAAGERAPGRARQARGRARQARGRARQEGGKAHGPRGLCAQAGLVGCSCTRLGFQPGFSSRYFSRVTK